MDTTSRPPAQQDGATECDKDPTGKAGKESLTAGRVEIATGPSGQGDIAQMHQADDEADGQIHDRKLQRQRALMVEELGQQSTEENNGLGVAGRDQKGLTPQGKVLSGSARRAGQHHTLLSRAGGPQRLVTEIDEVAATRQLEGEEQRRQGLQQGANAHGDQQDEDGLTEQIRADGEQRRAPTELQAIFDDQQDIGARGQRCQQIGKQEQHPCIQVHIYPL
jgi:hypothetical protein